MSDVRHACVMAGEGAFAVTIEATETEEGVSCFVHGGTLPHVGGMALAAPGPVLHGRQLSRADVWTATVPGHKDAEAARGVARRLAIALQQPASVSCGIHVDDATPDDLAQLGRNVDAAVDALLDEMTRRSPSPVPGEDQLVLVDLLDRPLGSCGKLEAHERGLLHRAFSVLLLDGDRLLMTRRALGKYHSAGLWTNTCCSHPRVGETLDEAVPRRLAEELGIADPPTCREVGTYCYRASFPNGLTEYELDHVLVGEWSGRCRPDPAEVMDVRWVPVEQVVRDVTERSERFTAWLPGVLHVALGSLPPAAP